VRVLDGDTIEVLHEGRGERVRLAHIDCPEKSQAFGQRAKQFTSELAFGREVTVLVLGFDRNKRTIGEVRLLDGTSLNRELVQAGFAWWYRAYSHDQSFEDLERDAMAAKRGLWESPHSIPPWQFRKSNRH
jgi:endonuclease YncB( thermonuclease family)